jgi:hypothetical protein
MKRIKLMWYGPYNVAYLSEILKQPVSVSDEKYPTLKKYGFYMFLDNKLFKVLYIGQAFDDSPRSLRNRIRWEIIKDGNGVALSKFYATCEEHGINVSSLNLKVAHIDEALYNKKPIVHDPKLMNDIENALINRMQPLLNKKGKKEYKGQSLEIFNGGSFEPLPRKIPKYQYISVNSPM